MCSRFDHHQDSTVVFKRSLKGIVFMWNFSPVVFGRCSCFCLWETRLRPFKGSLKILLNLEIGSSRGKPRDSTSRGPPKLKFGKNKHRVSHLSMNTWMSETFFSSFLNIANWPHKIGPPFYCFLSISDR